MDPKKITAGVLGTTALVFGGIDASKLEETPIQRIETVAGYTVEAKQVDNIVETTFPWKDQAGIKVSYDMGEPTLVEKVKDKRKKEVVTEVVDFGDGGFKVDILLDEKPDTNRFCYAIQGAENYDFFYQPPLTEQEIAEGERRLPEIEGSYAVYHKELKDHRLGSTNYETGKVMHIPRPQVWEVNNEKDTKQWADLSYENGQLCVTASQEFLDGAKYPVRIDPTFGYTSVGGTSFNLTSVGDVLRCRIGTPASSGTVTDVQFYLDLSSGSVNTIGFIYQGTNSSNKTFQTPAAASVSVNSATPQWWVSSTTTGPSVTGGTSYYACFFSDTTSIGAATLHQYRDTGGTSGDSILEKDAGAVTYPTVPSPWVVTTGYLNSASIYSIYATYTESGGASTTPNQNIILFE